MKKKLLIITAVMSLSLALAACEKTESSVSESILNETPIVSETSVVTETSTESSVEEQGEIVGDMPSLFDSFMTGSGKALVTAEGDSASYYSFTKAMKAGEEYTLEEIKENLKSYMAENGWGKDPVPGAVTYEIIDCGLDGKDDYHVTIEMPVPDIEDFVIDMILVEKEGKLVIAYDCDSWSRSQATILPNGEIQGGGSAGATHMVFADEYVDGDGNYVFGFIGEEESCLGSPYYYVPGMGGQLKVDLSEVDFEDVDISTIYFVKEPTSPSDIYVSIVSTKEGDEDVSFDASTPIGKIFADAGVNVLSTEDMQELMVNTLKERGFEY